MLKNTDQINNTDQKDLLLVESDNRKIIHDLRNCLSPILMQAQFLELHTETFDAEGIKKTAKSIEQSVYEMIVLINLLK